jgi:hypothetical protein
VQKGAEAIDGNKAALAGRRDENACGLRHRSASQFASNRDNIWGKPWPVSTPAAHLAHRTACF